MSDKLRTAMLAILKMGYFKNENARSAKVTHGHEDSVAKELLTAGFIEEKKAAYPNLKKGLLKSWAETGDEKLLRKATNGMKPGTFILQPGGTQGFPDVLVLDVGNRFVALECKSGQTGVTPMWNDNLPKPNTIYILSSGTYNETTIFLGRDVMSEKMLASQQKMMVELNDIVAKYRQLNRDLDEFNRGWLTKFRPQNFQEGGNMKTNYFCHNDRIRCEKNVLEYAAQ